MGFDIPRPPDRDLAVGDAGRIARDIKSGATTATSVVAAALERATAAVSLNAFTVLDSAGALQRATRMDQAIAAGHDPGPLTGVPIALKDIIDQAGFVTTAGSSFLDRPAVSDAPVVQRLHDAGAVTIGRAGLHEFAYGFSSENDWWGPVRNPWDPMTSPGGSSGGSAAAVAAGITPLGIGTDTGGSVRVPAALCGLVALKVSHGRVPLAGVFPLAPSLDTVGPMTRTVADAALVYSVLAGHDPLDKWSVDRVVDPIRHPNLVDLTIGVPHPWVDRSLAPEQEAGFAQFLAAMIEVGATVTPFEEPRLDPHQLPPAGYAEVAGVHREWFSADSSRYGPGIRQRLAVVFDLTSAEVAAATEWRSELRRAFSEAFERFDVIATPAAAARTKHIGLGRVDAGSGPEPYRPALSWFTTLVNQAGLPAVVLPIETEQVSGLPPSIQLIGPMWSEGLLLGIGLDLEKRDVISRRTAPTVVR